MKYDKELTRDFVNKKVIRDVFALFIPEGFELCELCGVNTLVRLGKGSLFDCTNCIFKIMDKIKYEGCPYELVGKDNLLK